MSKPNKHSSATSYIGPWIEPSQVPKLWQEFRRNHDPYTAAQMDDLNKTEKQRRDEQEERNSSMVEKEKLTPELKPSREIAQEVDAKLFNHQWLAEQRDAAFQKAAQSELSQDLDQEKSQERQIPREPERR